MPIIEEDDRASFEWILKDLEERRWLFCCKLIFEKMEPTIRRFAQEWCLKITPWYHDEDDRWLLRGHNNVGRDTIIQIYLDNPSNAEEGIVRIEASVFNGNVWVSRYSNARPKDNRIFVHDSCEVDSSLLNQHLLSAIVAVGNLQ